MNFDDFDRKLRRFETDHDTWAAPDVYLVARLDGRGFTKLLRQKHSFEAPFDIRFRDMMVETGRHLMDCGISFTLCYSQSDEISLLFQADENSFGRKERKLTSILAGEASAKFSLLLGDVASFDCRISQLPLRTDVVDYFRWRNEDARRNALSAHCYWLLRKRNHAPADAQSRLDRLSKRQKLELLLSKGNYSFDTVPDWQRQGWCLYWDWISKEAVNKLTGEPVEAKRRRLIADFELPEGEKLSAYIHRFLPPA